MRYAIISDIHSNIQALKAVLLDIHSNNIDEIICLGDVIGYGPAPAETLELAYANIHHFIMGNHDAVVAGLIAPDNFNDQAKKLIQWTCSRLDKKASGFFRNNPLLLTGDNFRCTHGEFEDPGRFGYIIEKEDAVASFNSCEEQLLFAGHSHVPGLFVVGSRDPHWLYPQNFGAEEGKKYIVNVGSIGQPRDGDIRASYCIFDDEIRDVIFRQIPFDVDGYREDMLKNSLPTETTYFLNIADDMPKSNIRNLIDFSQLTEADSVKTDNKEVDLREQVKKLKTSKRNLTITLIGLTIVTIILLFLIFSGIFTKEIPSDKQFIVNSLSTMISPSLNSLPVGKELITMPRQKGPITKDNPLDYWTMTLTDPESQNISVEEIESGKESEFQVFNLKSDILDPMMIAYLPVPAEKGMRFTASAQFKPLQLKSGFVEIMLIQKFKDGTEKILVKREPKNLSETDRWTPTSITISSNSPIAREGELYFIVKGQFKGEILLRKCSMKRKK